MSGKINARSPKAKHDGSAIFASSFFFVSLRFSYTTNVRYAEL